MLLRDQTKWEPGPGRERENILQTLDSLYHQSRLMLSLRKFTLEDARELSSYITGVRTLLTELALIEGNAADRTKATEAIRDMKDRYWELEGLVKEARNNLDRIERRS